MTHFIEWIVQMGEPLSMTVKKLLVVVVSMLPIIELKGTLPVALAWEIPGLERFLLAYIGSCIPVLPLLFLLRPIVKWMYTKPLFQRFAKWLEEKMESKGKLIYDYAYIGLFFFVAIPLPTTGVWTGSGAASLLRLDIKKSLPIILAGNLVAGTIVFLLGDKAIWIVPIGLLLAFATLVLSKIKNRKTNVSK